MRDYDPSTGRYLQPDPLGLVDGASVYGYARQNPYRFVDPTGQCPWCAVAFVGAVAGGGTELGFQLYSNGWDFGCVNWVRVGGAAALGATGGTYFNGLRSGLKGVHLLKRGSAVAKFRRVNGIRGRSTEVHHAIAEHRYKGFGSGFRNHFMNFHPMKQAAHRRIHGRWGELDPFAKPYGYINGLPTWVKVSAGSLGLGGLAEIAEGR